MFNHYQPKKKNKMINKRKNYKNFSRIYRNHQEIINFKP